MSQAPYLPEGGGARVEVRRHLLPEPFPQAKQIRHVLQHPLRHRHVPVPPAPPQQVPRVDLRAKPRSDGRRGRGGLLLRGSGEGAHLAQHCHKESARVLRREAQRQHATQHNQT
eukprot:952091-Prorocentrum_minimum.AAC.1